VTEYDNTNRGVLFKNAEKRTERSADYSGSLNVDGVEFFLDAWVKESSKDGRKFFSLSVKRKDKQPEPTRHERQKADGYQPQDFSPKKADDFSDDIPF
jgi:hypothetical protein